MVPGGQFICNPYHYPIIFYGFSVFGRWWEVVGVSTVPCFLLTRDGGKVNQGPISEGVTP